MLPRLLICAGLPTPCLLNFKKHILVEVEVIYAHEIMPDSFIRSEYCMSESEGVVTILHQVKNEAGNLNHCIAKTVWESSSVTACTNI